MDKEETKREIQKLFVRWQTRKEFTDSGMAALAFYGSLQSSDAPILQEGDFGPGDPYQIIHTWVIDWMKTWGKNQ